MTKAPEDEAEVNVDEAHIEVVVVIAVDDQVTEDEVQKAEEEVSTLTSKGAISLRSSATIAKGMVI